MFDENGAALIFFTVSSSTSEVSNILSKMYFK